MIVIIISDFYTTLSGIAKKLVAGGGIYINHKKIPSATERIYPNQHALHGELTILRKGEFVVFLSLLLLTPCREKAVSLNRMDLT